MSAFLTAFARRKEVDGATDNPEYSFRLKFTVKQVPEGSVLQI
jgi:hypothetical protein